MDNGDILAHSPLEKKVKYTVFLAYKRPLQTIQSGVSYLIILIFGMLTFASDTYSINEVHNGDALAVRPDFIAAFDGVSSENANGAEAKDEFLEMVDAGNSVEDAIKGLIQQQRHMTTMALARITPDNELKIYRIGDSRVRVHDENGKLVYQTPDQNLFGEIKTSLGLVNAFYDRPRDQIFADIFEQPELRDKYIRICNEFMTNGSGISIFSPQGIKQVLEVLNQLGAFMDCKRETDEMGYSKTLLKMLFDASAEFLNYCLADPESMAFADPVKVLTPKQGYRIVVGTDGIFAHMKESMTTEIINLRTIGFAIKALVNEAFRRGKRMADASGVMAALASA